jgi:hypothetical protein
MQTGILCIDSAIWIVDSDPTQIKDDITRLTGCCRYNKSITLGWRKAFLSFAIGYFLFAIVAVLRSRKVPYGVYIMTINANTANLKLSSYLTMYLQHVDVT